MVDRRSYNELAEKVLLVKRKKKQIKQSVKDLEDPLDLARTAPDQ
jgi:hypothetical protein